MDDMRVLQVAQVMMQEVVGHQQVLKPYMLAELLVLQQPHRLLYQPPQPVLVIHLMDDIPLLLVVQEEVALGINILQQQAKLYTLNGVVSHQQ